MVLSRPVSKLEKTVLVSDQKYTTSAPVSLSTVEILTISASSEPKLPKSKKICFKNGLDQLKSL